mgnify:CR=1 FL=1
MPFSSRIRPPKPPSPGCPFELPSVFIFNLPGRGRDQLISSSSKLFTIDILKASLISVAYLCIMWILCCQGNSTFSKILRFLFFQICHNEVTKKMGSIKGWDLDFKVDSTQILKDKFLQLNNQVPQFKPIQIDLALGQFLKIWFKSSTWSPQLLHKAEFDIPLVTLRLLVSNFWCNASQTKPLSFCGIFNFHNQSQFLELTPWSVTNSKAEAVIKAPLFEPF